MSDNNKHANTPTKRFMRLAGMTASITGKVMSNSVKSLVGSAEQKAEARSEMYQEIGKQIANTLGEMKGAVMKVGQIASQYQDIFPPEIAAAMTKLQKEAPPMPFSIIEQQILHELGAKPHEKFAEFEETPFAAASIGQVHKAKLVTGEQVIVKIQYPGVDECCESDLKHLRMALKLAGVIKLSKELQEKLFDEIRSSLHAELDYVQEAANLTEFRAFHVHDDKVIIPQVYTDYSSRRVLTLSYEAGDSLSQAKHYPTAIRNEIGERLFHVLCEQMYHLHALHCDSHPGNFAFRADGSLIIYDFGCIKRLNPLLVNDMKRLVRAALANDYATVEVVLRDLGIRTQIGEVPPEYYLEWIEILLAPLKNPQFDFAHSHVHDQVLAKIKSLMKYWDSFQPSAETMMVNRAIGGHYWNFVNLGVNINLNKPLMGYLSQA
ncbi:ABC1 kinase family protein [Agitococcus lubricus]|uniref:ABC1 family protein n=1 Tax=Agitococcus lubricus TaxID=1077255 RepID=A0A2T5IUZ7_9GAMM|nr:AarF/ABC1/UbiB kinase family protein [Agitococcus lubricus]PTQ87706.1 ABC1 family protein [Agitococcus lubricus]